MKPKKIAITTKDNSKIWNNGLTQNGYFLIKLLRKLGYNVTPVNEFKQYFETGIIGDDKIILLNKDNIKNYDIILEVCFSLTDVLYNYAIKNGVKVVSINYGNILALAQENLILDPNESQAMGRKNAETWISPHFEYSSGFLESTSEVKPKICPYIWSSEVFDDFCKKNKFNPFYNNEVNLKKLGIFESNINIIKTCIYPLISAEKLERKNKQLRCPEEQQQQQDLLLKVPALPKLPNAYCRTVSV